VELIIELIIELMDEYITVKAKVACLLTIKSALYGKHLKVKASASQKDCRRAPPILMVSLD